MKNKLIHLLIALMMLFSSCTARNSTEMVQPASQVTKSPLFHEPDLMTETPTRVVKPTFTPSSTPTFVPFPPTRTIMVPTVTVPSPTLAAQMPSPTSYPTLTPKERDAYYLNLLKTNGNCELPCFWGLRPEVSTYQELVNLFVPAFGRPDKFRRGDDPDEIYFPVYAGGDNDSDGTFFVTVKPSGVIKSFYFEVSPQLHAYSRPYLYNPELDDAMQRYSMREVLLRLGPPSQVYLELQSDPIEKGAPWPYRIWLVYDELGIVGFYEYYDAYISRNEQWITVCPMYKGLTYLYIYVQSSVTPDILNNILDQHVFDEMRVLADATDLSPQTFYEQMIKPEGSACFKSPVDLW